jgi:hypothetical protein
VRHDVDAPYASPAGAEAELGARDISYFSLCAADTKPKTRADRHER